MTNIESNVLTKPLQGSEPVESVLSVISQPATCKLMLFKPQQIQSGGSGSGNVPFCLCTCVKPLRRLQALCTA